jgi:hypothetical protein
MKMAVIFPDWNSIESVTRWHRGFEIAGFIALGLLLLFEILSYVYGNRKDALSILQQASIAEQAKQEQAAHDRQAAQDVKTVTGAAQKAADAQKAAEQEAAELRTRLAPRRLSKEQIDKLSSFLDSRPKGTFVIKCSINVDDARQYAEEIAGIFRAKGWTVRIDNAMFSGTNVGGLWITGKNPGPVPMAAQTVFRAFETSGILIRLESDPSLPEETDGFWLCIGHK